MRGEASEVSVWRNDGRSMRTRARTGCACAPRGGVLREQESLSEPGTHPGVPLYRFGSGPETRRFVRNASKGSRTDPERRSDGRAHSSDVLSRFNRRTVLLYITGVLKSIKSTKLEYERSVRPCLESIRSLVFVPAFRYEPCFQRFAVLTARGSSIWDLDFGWGITPSRRYSGTPGCVSVHTAALRGGERPIRFL